ncbi:MAG TPA: hypothetical protein PKA38_04525 [Candidatus Levybacteria bacterium]|nr:hypothetical protein [Candidatus Levybacteria bacterium]
MGIENQRNLFIRPQDTTHLQAINGVKQAVYTLFKSPTHKTPHLEIAEMIKETYQPLQPPIYQVEYDLRTSTREIIDPKKRRKLKGKELIHIAGVLMQFTDYSGSLQLYAKTPYEHVEALTTGITRKAAETSKPTTFPEQLNVALIQTEGDLPEALWRLFISSRMNARWLDGKSIPNLPQFTQAEQRKKMIDWQNSLAACKSTIPQDVAGDTYYAWTHALASVIYEALPARSSWKTGLAKIMFQNGTKIMHGVAHKINPQSLPNDHSIASKYGNAMGKECANMLKMNSRTQ